MTWNAAAPKAEGAYYAANGWTVRDPRTGLVAYSGGERGAKAYARAMNRREA